VGKKAKKKEFAAMDTRTRILETAADLLVRRSGGEISMADIAVAASVSRQAVYLHFADRAALFVALVEYVDEKRGINQIVDRFRSASSGMESLRIMAEIQAQTNPDIWPLARASEAIRRTDEAMEQAWQNRLQHRHSGCRQIVKRLSKEGSLRPDLSIDIATDLLWSITSLRTWEDLVLGRKWKKSQYEEYVFDLLVRALTSRAGGAVQS